MTFHHVVLRPNLSLILILTKSTEIHKEYFFLTFQGDQCVAVNLRKSTATHKEYFFLTFQDEQRTTANLRKFPCDL
jgi:hypothetical protein